MAENNIIITNLNPASYQAMISGRFDDALEALLRDPQELSRFLKALDNAISENKSHALEIKDRNFFERLFASNTTDLANVAYEQNVVMSAFYLILRLQNTKTEASQKLLAQLYSYADKEAKTTGKEQNNIQKLILDVLNKNAYDNHLDEVRDKALMKLLRSAEYQHQFEDEMREETKTARENYESAKVARDTALQTLSTQINTFTEEVQKKQHLFEEEICKEVNKKQDVIADLDSIRSGATLGATAIQEHQDIRGKADKSDLDAQIQKIKGEVNEKLNKKQNIISDIDSIRTNAQKGATSLQPTDIADWAKAKDKPFYTADEVGALPNSAFIPSKMSDLENDKGFLIEQDISGKADTSYVNKQLQDTTKKVNQEIESLKLALQTSQKELNNARQGHIKLKKAFIATSICIGTISLGALIALLILIL